MSSALWSRIGLVAWVLSLPLAAADKALSRSQALQSLAHPSAEVRRAGTERLREIGKMADADKLHARLHDDNEQVRLVAADALWQVWGRSRDRATDALYQRGVQQMELSRLGEAVLTFSEIIRRVPSFAEAWNKRATIYYLFGECQLSMKDCDEVLKRNRSHFGALSGYGQMHLNLGDFDRAIGFFERALKVNPDLTFAAATMQLLYQQQRNKQRSTI